MNSKKVWLITGAGRGMGVDIAKAALAAGHDVVATGRNPEKVRNAIGDHDNLLVVQLDVTSPADAEAAVETAVQRFGRIDVLVNNAGNHEDALLATMPAESWKRVLAANLDGVFHGCQAVLPTMIGQRAGRIVNLSSLSALLAPAGQANYAAAKAGVVALTQSLAKEVARIGITVNVVCPGFVETEALAHLAGEERKAAQMKIPMRRFGRPEEVAATVRFLAGTEAGYVTGSVLKVDGGIL